MEDDLCASLDTEVVRNISKYSKPGGKIWFYTQKTDNRDSLTRLDLPRSGVIQ